MKLRKLISANTLLVLIGLAGLGLIFYPSIANWWNSSHATRAVEVYDDTVEKMSNEKKAELLKEAEAYNNLLAQQPDPFFAGEGMDQKYEDTLNIDDRGMIGSLTIPSINVNLPIYHGTDEGTLRQFLGHIQGTSLPVGMIGSHAAISGHSGLPSQRLFTDLERLREGDMFTLHVAGKNMTYQVDQIRTVLPDEIQDLKVIEGEDLVTLVTCTPYGINTHRLLVRGHRVTGVDELLDSSQSSILLSRTIVMLILTVFFILVLLIGFFIYRHSQKRKQRRKRAG